MQRLKMCRFARDWHPRFGRESRSIKVRISMAKMKVAQVPKPGADFEIVEREIPNPGAGHVRIRVQACGICHRDRKSTRLNSSHGYISYAGFCLKKKKKNIIKICNSNKKKKRKTDH